MCTSNEVKVGDKVCVHHSIRGQFPEGKSEVARVIDIQENIAILDGILIDDNRWYVDQLMTLPEYFGQYLYGDIMVIMGLHYDPNNPVFDYRLRAKRIDDPERLIDYPVEHFKIKHMSFMGDANTRWGKFEVFTDSDGKHYVSTNGKVTHDALSDLELARLLLVELDNK